MQNKTVLVTGGAGYIGSHACQALAAAGFQPVVYDNLSTGHADSVRFGPLEEGDIRDAAHLQNVLAKYNPIAVMHFAALISVAESVSNPAIYYHVNTHGTWALLQTLQQHALATGNPPLPLIFSSTAAVYGIPNLPTPLDQVAEDAPLAPINPYGHSKYMVEQMLADYHQAYGQRYAILRYFNAAGASLDATLGLRHPNPPHLIPSTLESILGTRPPMSLFGADYPTPDGTPIRDYVHVADLATAHTAALTYLLNGGTSLTCNLGSGQGYSVTDVLRTVQQVTGQPVPHTVQPRRAGDPPALVADSTRAHTILGWKASHSDLTTIVATSWAWRTRSL